MSLTASAALATTLFICIFLIYFEQVGFPLKIIRGKIREVEFINAAVAALITVIVFPFSTDGIFSG
jgi:hypothetical protein